MAGLLKQNGAGMLDVDFGERAVLMANHQIYTDWLYLWWIAYTNATPTHGHIYIILKQSLKWVPIIGPAMQFYGFVFMARKWAKDQQRLRYRLQKLNSQHSGPLSGTHGGGQLDPMWLLIFPEGTNLSANTRASSAKFASKENIPDMKHLLLPAQHRPAILPAGTQRHSRLHLRLHDSLRGHPTRSLRPRHLHPPQRLLPRPAAQIRQHALAPLRHHIPTPRRPRRHVRLVDAALA